MSARRPLRWALLVPFAYLWRSRLEEDRAVFGMVVFAEWVPAVLVLHLLHGLPLLPALGSAAGGYLAFITLYELGYLANDLLAVGRPAERSRLGEDPPGAAWVAAGAVARGAVFAGLTVGLDRSLDFRWWGFYALLVLGFTAHNLLRPLGARVLTFVFLATARFLAPVFWLLAPASLALLLPPVLLCYTLQRTLAYLESKGALDLPGRAETGFKVRFYAALLLPSGLVALLAASWVPLLFNAYFLGLWSVGLVVGVGRRRPGARTPAP